MGMTSVIDEAEKAPSTDSSAQTKQAAPEDIKSEIAEGTFLSWISRHIRRRKRLSGTDKFTSDGVMPKTTKKGNEDAQQESDSSGKKKAGSADDKQWQLINQVPQAVEISTSGPEPTLRIPPFGRVIISQTALENYHLEEWLSRGVLVKEQKVKQADQPEQVLLIIWGGGFFTRDFSGLSHGVLASSLIGHHRMRGGYGQSG
jgi:hypothetical protein